MKRMQLQIAITLDEEAVAAVVALMRKAFPDSEAEDEKREARIRASRHALFGGQRPPEDKGLLIDSKQVAKLLKVCEKTVWTMYTTGKMPPPIRIGRAVRWSYEELKAWVAARCPTQEESKGARK